jgi:surface polysaccharide O-acyltransferase-like enzyme
MYRLGTDPDMSDYMLQYAVFETLAHNGTMFFALISGLLYATVLGNRGWRNFFRGKLLNVIAPYALFTLVYTAVGFSVFVGLVPFSGGLSDYALAAISNFGSGQASFHLWYIPVLAALFVLTPIIVWIVRQPWGNWVIILLMLPPLLFSRSFDAYSVENVLVFLAPYAFGIWLGSDYEKRIAGIGRVAPLLLALLFVSSVATTLMVWKYVGPLVFAGKEWEGAINWYESISYIQKMTLACVILVWLKAHKNWLPRWLDLLANYAFAIYFLHIAVYVLIIEGLLALGVSIGPVWIHSFTIPLLLAATLGISVGISIIVKKMLGRKSRIIIGA